MTVAIVLEDLLGKLEQEPEHLKKTKEEKINENKRGRWLKSNGKNNIITRKKKAGKRYNNRRIVYGGEMLWDVHKENK